MPTAITHTPGPRRSSSGEASLATFPPHRLESRFLARKDGATRAHIYDLATRVAAELDAWAARFPAIRRARVLPLALSVSAAAPFAGVRALVSTARVSLWVFTLDDLCDEERLPVAELADRLDAYRQIGRGLPGPDANEPLAVALREIRDDLAQYPLFAPLAANWRDALLGTIDAMEREEAWRTQHRRDGDAALPAYADYLGNGRYSIGGPPHIWSALATLQDRSIPRHREHLLAMERVSSICVRLANDLRSDEKEQREGKINSLLIAARAFERGGALPADARLRAATLVRADLASALADLVGLQAMAPTDSGQAEAAIADIARFVSEFYDRHDYHTFAAESTGADR